MLPTLPVGSLKSFKPRLHQPLPLTPREADKLLNVLKNAFRTQLDREHPVHDDTASTTSPPRRFPVNSITRDASSFLSQDLSSSLNTSRASNPPIERHARHTDNHVRAILGNPLFSYDRTVEAAAGPNAKRNPMDVFDAAVAKGMMTTQRAAGCLNAAWRDAVNSNSASLVQAIAETRAGTRVVQWLRSSGMEHDLTFMAKSPGLTSLLLKFMAAERLDGVVWSWLERLAREDGPPEIKQEPAFSFVLRRFILAKAFEAMSLDEGYECMLRAENMLRDVGADVEKNLLDSWKRLSHLSTGSARPLISKPAPTLYERFMALGDLFCAPGLSVERAQLELHHPTRPSSDSAEVLLHKEVEDVEEITAPYRLQLKLLGLDAAKHLQAVGKTAEALDLLQLLRDKLGELAPPRRDGAAFAHVLKA